jgi:hypothetical protein
MLPPSTTMSPWVDVDAELDAFGRRNVGTPFAHRLLHIDGTAQRVDNAGKLDQQLVAGGLGPAQAGMRPLCSAIFGSASSRRIARSRASVPSSSAPISRL